MKATELLWINRDRLLHGKPVRGLRQVDIASTTDQENRRLTTVRKEAGQEKTRIVNRIRHLLRHHNLQWEMPTKRLPTLSVIAWSKQVVLPEIDRLEMNHLLADLEQVQQRLKELEAMLA
jgi:transposase